MKTETIVTDQANDLAQQHRPEPKWAAKIEDQYVPAPQRKVTVRMLMDQANVPAGHVLVRDLGGEHDVALNPADTIDLAEGNVFYAMRECEAPKPTGCNAVPKLAFFVDDRPEETLRADQTGRTLRELFGFSPEVLLFRDYESPKDQSIGMDDLVRFVDGPVFYTRRRHSKPKHIEVAVITTSGTWPEHGFESIPIDQPVKVQLQHVVTKLKITDTTGWVAKVGNRELDIEKSYLENQLCEKVEIDYGPREGGGGNE